MVFLRRSMSWPLMHGEDGALSTRSMLALPAAPIAQHPNPNHRQRQAGGNGGPPRGYVRHPHPLTCAAQASGMMGGSNCSLRGSA